MSKKVTQTFTGEVSFNDFAFNNIDDLNNEEIGFDESFTQEKISPDIAAIDSPDKDIPAISPSTKPVKKQTLVKKASDVLKKKESKILLPKQFKLLSLNTEKEMIKAFVGFAPKLYLVLKLNQKQQTFYYVFHYVLHKMEENYLTKFNTLLRPTEEDLQFYKNPHTKSLHHVFADEIKEKGNINLKISVDDYELLFVLMNTFYKNLDNPPTKYSTNFFFFEIVRFIEKNIKLFK